MNEWVYGKCNTTHSIYVVKVSVIIKGNEKQRRWSNEQIEKWHLIQKAYLVVHPPKTFQAC